MYEQEVRISLFLVSHRYVLLRICTSCYGQVLRVKKWAYQLSLCIDGDHGGRPTVVCLLDDYHPLLLLVVLIVEFVAYNL